MRNFRYCSARPYPSIFDYRWRPWPDQNATLMEVRLLARNRWEGAWPEAADMRFLTPQTALGHGQGLGRDLGRGWLMEPLWLAGARARCDRRPVGAGDGGVPVRGALCAGRPAQHRWRPSDGPGLHPRKSRTCRWIGQPPDRTFSRCPYPHRQRLALCRTPFQCFKRGAGPKSPSPSSMVLGNGAITPGLLPTRASAGTLET